jgi:hypothetical protein
VSVGSRIETVGCAVAFMVAIDRRDLEVS